MEALKKIQQSYSYTTKRQTSMFSLRGVFGSASLRRYLFYLKLHQTRLVLDLDALPDCDLDAALRLFRAGSTSTLYS